MDYYQDHWFSGVTSACLVGEVDPDYLYFEVALDRMARTLDLKNTKFLFIFREPVARAFSHYLMSYRRGLDQLSFGEAIAAEPERIRSGYYERLHYSYLDRGYYYRQVLRFLQCIDRKQMLFILTEELSNHPEQVMSEVFRFLEIKDIESSVFHKKSLPAKVPRSVKLLRAVKSNGVHKRAIRVLLPFPAIRKKLRQHILDWNETEEIDIALSENTRSRLKALYREENRKLSELIGRDLAAWC